MFVCAHATNSKAASKALTAGILDACIVDSVLDAFILDSVHLLNSRCVLNPLSVPTSRSYPFLNSQLTL